MQEKKLQNNWRTKRKRKLREEKFYVTLELLFSGFVLRRMKVKFPLLCKNSTINYLLEAKRKGFKDGCNMTPEARLYECALQIIIY